MRTRARERRKGKGLEWAVIIRPERKKLFEPVWCV